MDERKRVFISVPMAGKEETLIEKHILETERRYLKKRGLDCKDVRFRDNFSYVKILEEVGHKFGSPDIKHESLEYLGFAIGQMAECDEVVFATGWRKARGCRVEMKICKEYGIPVTKI